MLLDINMINAYLVHLFTPAFKPYSALLATKTYTGMPLSHKKKKKTEKFV